MRLRGLSSLSASDSSSSPMPGVAERRPSSALRGSDGGRPPRRCDPKDDFRSTDGGMALAAADGAFGDGTSAAGAASRRTTGSDSEGPGGGVGEAAAALFVSGWNLTPAGGTAEDGGAELRHRRAEVGRDEDDGLRRAAIEEHASSFDEQPSSSVAGRLPLPPAPRSLSTGDGRLEKTSTMEPVVEAREETEEEEEDIRRSRRRSAARREGRLPLEERPGRVSAGGPARRRCGRPTAAAPGDDLTDIDADPTDLPDDDLADELSSSVWQQSESLSSELSRPPRLRRPAAAAAVVVEDGARRARDLPGPAARRGPPSIPTAGDDGSSSPPPRSVPPAGGRRSSLPAAAAAVEATPTPTFPRKAAASHRGQLCSSVFHSPVWRLRLRSCITVWDGHAPPGVRGAAVFVDVVDDDKDAIGITVLVSVSFPSIVPLVYGKLWAAARLSTDFLPDATVYY